MISLKEQTNRLFELTKTLSENIDNGTLVRKATSTDPIDAMQISMGQGRISCVETEQDGQPLSTIYRTGAAQIFIAHGQKVKGQFKARGTKLTAETRKDLEGEDQTQLTLEYTNEEGQLVEKMTVGSKTRNTFNEEEARVIETLCADLEDEFRL